MSIAQDASDWEIFLQESRDELVSNGLRRTRTVQPVRLAATGIRSERHAQLNFGSNDYLGLRHHPAVIAAAASALSASGLGSGASPLITGYSGLHAELEKRLAEVENAEAAVVFSSGFACNAGVIPCLLGSHDAVLSDQLNHASLIDGCRLSRAKTIVFPHTSAESVRATLKAERHRFRRVLIVTESVFSMDGDQAPLGELVEIAETYDAGLIVDEAHATGVYGQQGAGLAEELGLERRMLAKLCTLSKALGCVGGFVCGSQLLVDFMVNRCRTYIYSTSLPACVAAGAIASLKLARTMTAQRQALRAVSRKSRSALQAQGWQVPDGDSPIVPVIVGDTQRAMQLSQQLAQSGLFVPAIRPPTVPTGTARLRISLSATHSEGDVDYLVRAFSELLSQVAPIG